MNMTRWIKDVQANPVKRPLPVLSFPGARMIDVTINDLVHNGDLLARCMKAIADRYPTLASVSNMDLSVEAEAFGAPTFFFDEEVPSIKGSIVATAEDAEKLVVPAVGTGRTGECIRAIEIASTLIKDRPILAGVIGPFSLSGRLFDMTEIMYHAADEPETVHMVLSKAAEFITNYIKAFREAGANGIVMAEPAAGLLSPAWNEEFSALYVRKIVEAVQDDNFMVVYHNCGNTIPLADAIVATGAKAFHFGNAIDLTNIIDKIPTERLVLGNIDPATQFFRGTPESIREATQNLRQRMSGHANFVPSSGCDIPPLTPFENIDAFFAAAAQ